MQDNRIPRPMTEAEILRRRELRRAAIKKQKRRRTLFLTACGLAAVLLITGIVLLCRGCGRTEGRSHNESIYGSFAMSDKSCVYTFREDGSGELRFPAHRIDSVLRCPAGRPLSTLKPRHWPTASTRWRIPIRGLS